MNKKYVDYAKTLKILRQDSGLLPKPRENWNTFIPYEGDYAIANGIEYRFDGTDWEEVVEEETNEN